jgi:hypothetical protein
VTNKSMIIQKARRVRLSVPELDSQIQKRHTKTSHLTPFDEIVLGFRNLNAHVYRLRYIGVPSLVSKKGKFNGGRALPESAQLVNRDAFVLKIFSLLKSYPSDTSSGHSYFNALCDFIRYLDSISQHNDDQKYNPFTVDNISSYNAYLSSQILKGKHNNGKSIQAVGSRKSSLKKILIDLGYDKLAVELKRTLGHGTYEPTIALGSKDHVTICRILLQAFNVYVKHYQNKTIPETCPIYDGIKFNSNLERSYATRSMKGPIISSMLVENRLSALAILLYCYFSGSSSQPARSIIRSKIEFIKEETGQHYRLTSKKGRSQHRKEIQKVGFTKRTKDFLENWMLISHQINPATDSPLFPFYDFDGNLSDKCRMAICPQTPFNKALKMRGLPSISSRIFRATRSAEMQRSFEDSFLTADANNNSVNTTIRHYSEGDPRYHDRSLGRGVGVMFDISKGKDKAASISKFEEKLQDPFTSTEWREKKESVFSLRTPNGPRCTSPFGKARDSSHKKLELILKSSEGASCISYLSCLDCESHALVAEFDDIWSMLSFRDSIVDALSRPSLNSIPVFQYELMLGKVDVALERYKRKAPSVYQDANAKNNIESHPMHELEFNPESLGMHI